MRILITGATGFIGRHVIDQLKSSRHNILASTLEKDKIENSPWDVSWLYGDLAELGSLKAPIISYNPDVVLHLAWMRIPNYSESISRINLTSSIELLDFLLNKTNCRKIIVSGSCWEYGKDKGVCKEDEPVIVNSYFTWAKHALNQYLLIKCAEKDVTLNWFRIFYLYGPGQREGSLIPTLIRSISQSIIPTINTPMNKNDFVFVGDVARALTRAVDLDVPSGIYNLGSGRSTSVYDICRIVERQQLGSATISQNVLYNGAETESVNFWADMSKTKEELNMLCDTLLRDGIKSHIHSMQSEVYN